MNPQGNPESNTPMQEINSSSSILVQQQNSQRYPPLLNQQPQQGASSTGVPFQAVALPTIAQQQAGNQQAPYSPPGLFSQRTSMQPAQPLINAPQSFIPGQQALQQQQATLHQIEQLLQTLALQQQQQTCPLAQGPAVNQPLAQGPAINSPLVRGPAVNEPLVEGPNQPLAQGPAVNPQQFQRSAYPPAASGINTTSDLISQLQHTLGLMTQQHNPNKSFYTSLETSLPQSGSSLPDSMMQQDSGVGPPVEPSDGNLESSSSDFRFKTAQPYHGSSAEQTFQKTTVSKPLPAGHPLAKQKEERMRKEIEQAKLNLVPLASRIIKKLRDGTEGKRCNILLIGMPGVGKSSLTNSLLMALNEQGYKELAKRGNYGEGGKGGRSAITLTIQGHPLFHPKYFKESCPERKYQCQPVIFDCPGFIDNEDPNIKTLMKLIINGQLKENTNIANALETPLEGLKAMYKKADRSREIDIVLVVHAATDPIPENVMDAIRNAALPDEEGARQVSLFGVITKLDKLEDKEENLPHIERAMAEQIGLGGIENRIFSTPLYCAEVMKGRRRVQEVDEVLCQLWDAILSPEHLGNESKSQWGGILGMFKK